MPTPPPVITPVPTPAPQRGDRATFSDRVDAFVSWLEIAGAEFQAVADNVYSNATIAEGSGDVAAVGLGIIGASPLIPNVDDATIASGFYYINATTTGTLPLAASTATIYHKVYGTAGFQLLNYAGSNRVFFRTRTASAWAAWEELANLDSPTFTGTVSGITKAMVGLGNVDNTSDADKPVSTAQQTALNAKLNLTGGTVTGGLTLSSNFTLSSTAPAVRFTETDQAGALGEFRIMGEAAAWRVDRNTAAAKDFSTFDTPISISSAGAITLTSVTCSGLLNANAGVQINNAGALITGGALATLANNGYLQTGINSSLNLVFDYTNVQARNNGTATTLNLNALGGLVQCGAGLNVVGNATVSSFNSINLGVFQNTSNDKIGLYEGATPRGYLGANSGNCFIAINSANTIAATTIDNSGNLTAAGNITANSDERLKKDWEHLAEDFLYRVARVKIGTYTRIDSGERQAGASAQDMQAILPEVVPVNQETGVLSLAYGNVALLTAIKLAQKVEALEQRILDLEKAANK